MVLSSRKTAPIGWGLSSANPAQYSFNPSTGIIQWLFFGSGIQDLQINYTLNVPGSATGLQVFTGSLQYTAPGGGDITEPISGDSNLDECAYTITAHIGRRRKTFLLPEMSNVDAWKRSKLFNITPDTGYHILDVLVDGGSVGAVDTYTFYNVTEDHTIHTTFELIDYTITATSGAGGKHIPLPEMSM